MDLLLSPQTTHTYIYIEPKIEKLFRLKLTKPALETWSNKRNSQVYEKNEPIIITEKITQNRRNGEEK